MSKLILTSHDGAIFKLNITQFQSVMSASINSVQVKSMQHHFPIRAGQPDVEFTAQFSSMDGKHKFQDFVRDHQRQALSASFSASTAVTLLWPERNILNWTGYIISLPIREARFDYAPRITFGVSLVNSLLSSHTFAASLGNFWRNIYGQEIVPYIPYNPDIDFTPPIPPSAKEAVQNTKETVQQTTGFLGSIANSIGSLFR